MVVVTPRPHPPAEAHGDIQEVFPDIFLVKGAVSVGGLACSRNMTIVRQPKDDNTVLILINAIRLGDEGLKKLDQLGRVTHIIKLAGHHGKDDPFYKERYPDATVWAPAGADYFVGLNYKPNESQIFFQADQVLAPGVDDLPLEQARVMLIESSQVPEAVLLLERPGVVGKILITGDSLQNWSSQADQYFSFFSKWFMWWFGFLKSYNVGPAWYQTNKVQKKDMVALLQHEFDHVLPAHGDPCLQEAYKKYQASVEALT